jgi:hypothetical protein
VSGDERTIVALLVAGLILIIRLVRSHSVLLRVGGTSYSSTESLAADARILLELEPFAIGPRLEDVVLEGRSGERVMSVSFGWVFDPWRWDPWHWRLDVAVVRFKIDVSRDVELDVRKAGRAKEPVARAFRELGARRVRAVNGRLWIEAPLAGLPLGSWSGALDLLAELARELERPLAVVRASSELRCAYCHAGGELVPCVSCNTLLHAGCWVELGRCPVLGCRGAGPKRAATRASI